jgi:hypothetical protein
MKPRIFLALLLLAVSTQILAQQIEYDFVKGTYNDHEKLRYDGTTSFRIINFNTFKYKAQIKATKWEFQTSPPDEFKSAFRLKTTTEAAIEQSSRAVEMMSDLKAKNTTTALDDSLDKLVAACTEYLLTLREVEKKVIFYDKLITLTQQERLTHDTLLKATTKLTAEYSKSDYWSYNKFEKAYQKAVKAYVGAKAKAIKESKALETKDIAAAESILLENYKKLEEVINQLDIFLHKLQKQIEDPNSFIVQSYPLQSDADEVTFGVKIAKVDETAFPEATSFTKTLPTYGGFRTDFSVGPSFSFGDNSLNETAYLDTNSTSVKYRKGGSSFRPGIMAMMHLTSRSAGYSSMGLSFGIGAGFESLTNINTSFALGLTWVLGRLNKIFVTGGLVYQQVSRPIEGTPNSIKKGTAFNASSYTENVYRSAPFLSISYAIGSRK